MSSPVHDDGDKRAMYIPPWAREERDDEETRRLQAEIVAAAERLKPPAPPRAPVSAPLQQKASVPSPAFQTRFNGDRRNSNASGDTFKIEDAIRDAWSPGGLDPVPMPPPPKPGGPTFGMVSRLAGAVGFAGIVALFVTGAIPLPSIDISMSSDSKDANAAAPAAPAAAELALANTRPHPALAPAANPPAQPTPAVLRTAAQPPQTSAATIGAAATATAPVASEPPKVKPPQAEAPRPASAIPEPRVLDYMSKEEIESLLKRGQDLVATGDISSGRLLLTRAAEAGEARASLAMARTFDAAVLATLGVVGTFPDPVKARAWYTKAAEQGSPEAARRLEQLASR
jgi:hypothetical protein